MNLILPTLLRKVGTTQGSVLIEATPLRFIPIDTAGHLTPDDCGGRGTPIAPAKPLVRA